MLYVLTQYFQQQLENTPFGFLRVFHRFITFQAVAAILKAAKRYGSEAGTRSFQRMLQRLAAYEFMSS